jgi:pimeloyl-ACP methyl ester carboxylesterase
MVLIAMNTTDPTTLWLCPGLACDAALWADQLPALAAWGQRQSPPWAVRVNASHTEHGRIEDMAAALLAAAPGPVVLVGASMGGMVALNAWAQAPERVRGIALLGSDPGPESDHMRALREAAIEVFFQEGGVEDIVRNNVALAFHPDQAAQPALVQRYLQMVLGAGTAQLVRQNRAVMARPDMHPRLSRIHCPVLVMTGDSDQLVAPALAHETAAALGERARLVVLPRCGHMLTMEKPAAVTTALLDWLDALK